jgi:hypothetical protein
VQARLLQVLQTATDAVEDGDEQAADGSRFADPSAQPAATPPV